MLIARFDDDVIAAHFGPERRADETVDEYRVRITRDGVPVDVDLAVGVSESSAVGMEAIDFEGRFTAPDSGRELYFGTRDLRLYVSCG